MMKVELVVERDMPVTPAWTPLNALRAMELCGARRRSGGQCRRPAGPGTEHLGIGRCSLHGGSTPAHMERARRDLALRELAVMGGRLEIEPTQALLECVYRAAGQAAWLRGKVESLSEDEVLGVGARSASAACVDPVGARSA
jgi:hypothetical protein